MPLNRQVFCIMKTTVVDAVLCASHDRNKHPKWKMCTLPFRVAERNWLNSCGLPFMCNGSFGIRPESVSTQQLKILFLFVGWAYLLTSSPGGFVRFVPSVSNVTFTFHLGLHPIWFVLPLLLLLLLEHIHSELYDFIVRICQSRVGIPCSNLSQQRDAREEMKQEGGSLI